MPTTLEERAKMSSYLPFCFGAISQELGKSVHGLWREDNTYLMRGLPIRYACGGTANLLAYHEGPVLGVAGRDHGDIPKPLLAGDNLHPVLLLVLRCHFCPSPLDCVFHSVYLIGTKNANICSYLSFTGNSLRRAACTQGYRGRFLRVP